MGSGSWIRRIGAAILATGFVVAATWVDREAWGQATGEGEKHSPIRVAERSNTPTDEPRLGGGLAPAQNDEHPLMPVLRWGQKSIKIAEAIQDYSATLVKRERHDGKLQETEYMFIKVRHKPLSVYMYFLKPDHFKGQEVIWIQGQNNGKMWGHGTGMRKVFGTVPLDPTGPIAMRGNRYPITEIGILNLVRRLVEEGEKDTHYGECEVKYFQGAKLNGRSCTCIQVVHPVPRKNFQFHIARIFVDDEYDLPVRFEAHDWPSSPGGPPELIEEYTYLNLKFNNGFTDADFDIRNPNYGFSKPR